MTAVVDRTCTEVPKDGTNPKEEQVGRPLSDYDSVPAYVLLGDPGSGKTTCFKQERRRLGDAAELVPARDLELFDVSDDPEWDWTLFIDGLDEVRAGHSDGRTALDQILVQLHRLRRPRFRLSCREADWLGAYDRKRLEKVAPEGELTVLRLDPLTTADVEKIVESEARVEDPALFLQEADAKGFKPLLANAQNLVLLIGAAADGDWPETRREMFELACRHLLQESNEEHLLSSLTRPGDKPMLEDAGRVCALLLLSEIPGVSPTRVVGSSDDRYPAVEFLDPIREETAAEAEALAHRRRLALSSRLFAAPSGDAPAKPCLEPVHRHIAEFLAGRYLAKRIRDRRLPAGRVTALLTAQDGGVVTPHRGLCAWLAAHSKQIRPDLIERDPVGVGLYGDVHVFSNAEKRRLLSALIREGQRLHDLGYGNAAAFAPLASPALERELHDRLKTSPQDDNDQLSTEFLLRVLRHGEPMPALAETILAIVYEPSWWPRVAYSAVDAFVRQCPDAKTRATQLTKLLDDIYAEQVPDPDGELVGRILDKLYPDVIGPAQIWSHLRRSQPTNLPGHRWLFWTRGLEEKTGDDALAVLLDELVAQQPSLAMVDRRSGEGRALVERLVARGLEIQGADLTPQRLCDWLTAPAQTYEDFFALRSSLGGPEASAGVRAWLEANPDGYKAALLEGLGRYSDDEDLRGRWLLAGEILRGAEPPADFGCWCLEQARRIVKDQPTLARRLFEEANWRLRQGEDGLSQELLDKAAQGNAALRPVQQAFVRHRESGLRHEANESAYRQERRQRQMSRRQRREQHWRDAVRAELPALRRSRAAPALLSSLAWEWLGSRPDVSLLDWLREELGRDDELAVAAYDGLVGVVHRPDLPGVDEIVRLNCESGMHRLSMPFLAALKDMDRHGKRSIDDLSEDLRRQALAFHFCVPTGDEGPDWYRHLVKESPDLVVSVLVPLVRSQLRCGREHVTVISELAYDSDHRELARRASLTLLRGYPMRGPASQLPNLIRLLWSALKHADHQELLKLIEKKLAGKSMAVAQRVHWLAAGLVASPNAYCERLGSFIDGKELRARQLASFLWSEPDLFRPDELSPAALEVVVRHLGRAFGRFQLKDGPVDPAQKAHWELQFLIQQISESPAPEAGAALRRLALDESLSPWRHHLRIASNRQGTIARDASYQTPKLGAIRATLDNLAPANAADLLALALDRLDEVARSIRSANTNDWSQFWNQEPRRPPWPKPENPCRDALLRLLLNRLPDGVSAEKEGQEVSDRRVDIRFSYGGFQVPIEVKKDASPDLWHAATDQLAAKYAQHTDGHGIYVVLWFGDPTKIASDGSGSRPASVKELRQRLQTGIARQLAPEQAHKIAVRVIDVSKP
ncbi:MAG: hypothetical protein F4Z19_13860 [Holophagales bacterium]|nr:hypothetical protein [Holophagales bacterium]